MVSATREDRARLRELSILRYYIIPTGENDYTVVNEVTRLHAMENVVVDTMQASLRSPVNEASFADVVPWAWSYLRTRIKAGIHVKLIRPLRPLTTCDRRVCKYCAL